MKKILSIVLAIVLCFSVVSTAPLQQKAIAEEGAENFEYTITNNGISITGVLYSPEFDTTDIVIPKTINGYPVTAIDDFAFESCGSVNGDLETIEIPDSVTQIGEGAFYNCSELWDVKLPENLEYIGPQAFFDCSSLYEITIPEGVTIIPNSCFAGCSNLSEIYLPDSVQYIETNAFEGTWYMQSSDNWDKDVLYLSNHIIATNVEDDYYYEDEIQPYSYTIKDGTKSISSFAFANNKNFSEIIMPDSIKYIGESAFDYCTNLTSVTLSKGLTEISRGMFGACHSLESITIPEGIKVIKDNVFCDCTALKTVSFPNSVEEIGDYAFYGCSDLNEIELPNQLTRIGKEAFKNTGYYSNDNNWIYTDRKYIYDDYYDYGYGYYDDEYRCKALYVGNYLITVQDGYSYYYSSYFTFEVRENTKVIADYAFAGYDDYYLTSIQIPSTVIGIGKSAFENCEYLSEITIPDSVLKIGSGIFSGCCNLQDVVLSNNLTEIPDAAFYNCDSLSYITLPNAVKRIGESAFYNCSISVITIPEGATEIGESAFQDCNSYSFYVSIPDSVTKIGKNAFAGTALYLDWDYEETGFLYIDNHLIAIDEYFSNEDFENGILEIKDGTLTIADGVFSNFSNLKCLIIPKSVKNIGSNLFGGSDNLKVICYMGSEQKWENISIGDTNDPLFSAEINYNFEHFTPGDVDNDMAVDLTDVVVLAQHVAKWDVSCNKLAVDVNGDLVTDLSDVVHLAQFVAQWDVELAPEIVIPKDENSNESSGSSSSGKQDAFNNANEQNIYKNAPEGTVHVLMWRKFHKSEQLLVDQYQKLTGNRVKVTVTTEAEYPTKLVSMVSGGNSPDVICFSAGNFPGLVTKALQPLQNKYFQLDSDCWNKAYMDAYKINGVYFGVAQPQSWSCESSTYVTYYSPQILKICGVTTTPYQLYNERKWDWKAQNDIATKVKNKGFIGLSVQSFDLFMLSAGVDFAKYDGSKYTNQLGSVKSTDLLTKAWMEAATLKQEDALTGWDLNNVQQGKVGLFTAISYGLYNEGNWFQNSFAKNLEAVPVAGPNGGTTYTPVRPMCWGVPKKAKNPEGAAYFLRYFLDTSAFDFDSTFHNKQFGKVYKIITSSSAKKTVMHGSGVTDYVESGTYSKICNALVATSPQNITAQLNAKKGSVNTGIARANKDLARIKK